MSIETTLSSTRLASWDVIGTDVSKATSLSEALSLSKLDFEVMKRPLYTNTMDSIMAEVPQFYATVGSDNKIRGVVRESYEVIENSDAFTLAEALHDEGNLTYVRGGETYKGLSYLIMALPEFKVLGDDIKLYFILQNSFAGQAALKAAIAPLRIACQNQFRVAFRDAYNTISIKHTSTAHDRLDQARQMLGYAGGYITAFQRYAEQLAVAKVTEAQVKAFIAEMFPLKGESELSVQRNNILQADFMGCYKAEDLVDFQGTAWGLLNAWQDFETHTVGFKPKAQAADYKFMQLANSGSNKATQVLSKLVGVAA